MKEDLLLAKRYQKEISLLEETVSLLDWDQQTYMPEGGSSSRAEQKSLLSSMIHKMMTADELFAAVKRMKRKKLSGDNKFMVDKLYNIIVRHKKLPGEFVEELSRQTSLAFSAWEKAKSNNDFQMFKPHLEKIVQLKQKQARYIGLPGHPYNSLLDEFEEGMTAEKLKPGFENLKTHLLALIHSIKKTAVYKSHESKRNPLIIPEDAQIRLCKDVIQRVGLSDKGSRLDFSAHPFTTTIGTNDVRITTNVRKNPLFAFESTLHEAGHALYELSIPEKFANTVLRASPSYGLHESQSRFWENMVGKGKGFWKYYVQKFNELGGLDIDFNRLYEEINAVHPGLIRVESDEIHYCLHIILRFEMELGLMEGSIKVKNLPEIWNARMKELIGISPANYADGVLQDVHWSLGAFGYFPSYALGTVYAAQLYSALMKNIPGIGQDIARGNFTKARKWLNEKIHRQGAKYQTEEVIRKICGEGLNTDVYVRYLTEKYRGIYGF